MINKFSKQETEMYNENVLVKGIVFEVEVVCRYYIYI